MTLLTPEGVVAVEVALSAPTSHALAHVHALHGHAHGCDSAQDVHVGLLLRAIGALGGRAQCIVIRAGRHPAFWLCLRRGAAVYRLDLGILDAICLLACQRVPVEVEVSSDADRAAPED
jgi:hypothetical protein